MDLKKASSLQEVLSSRILLEWSGGQIAFVAGADFGYSKKEERVKAVIVVMKFPELEVVEVTEAQRKVLIPYIPGFLCFREGPSFLAAYGKLRCRPDVTLVDGNGIAHPRRMGLASFVGVSLDIPTIGCAKKPFFPYISPADRRGASTSFQNKQREKVGFCLRTRTGVKPIFVSPGHRIDFERTRKVALACAKFRLPEPLREAHRLAQEMAR